MVYRSGGSEERPQNVFRNDGSFLEMFKKLQEVKKDGDSSTSTSENKGEAPSTSEKKQPVSKPPPFVGKRRGGRVLPTEQIEIKVNNMKKQKTKKKIKNILYVPPHARKKNETDSEINMNKPKRSKLCEDSSKIFEKAAEIEERQNQMYMKAMESLEGSSSTLDCELERGELGGDRPETCMVTAKRLVSHALGMKAVFSDSDLENMVKIVSARQTRKQNHNTLGKSAQNLDIT